MAQELVVIRSTGIRSGAGITLPAFFAPDAPTAKRVFEFFTANIRNPNTRKAYAKAAADFAAWCEARDLDQLRGVQPVASSVANRATRAVSSFARIPGEISGSLFAMARVKCPIHSIPPGFPPLMRRISFVL